MEDKLTHIDDSGRPKMVDVSDKDDTSRKATATATIRLKPETLKLITTGGMKKGDVLSVAQTAGIMASKNTSMLIPMCHNIFITGVSMDFQIYEQSNSINIFCTAETIGKTGIEMEALTAVSVAALTIYDMCKAVDKEMIIENICLLEKSGGRSGHFLRGGN